ncbi:MAG: hypothetical protein ABI216_11665 [Devosia sp.]
MSQPDPTLAAHHFGFRSRQLLTNIQGFSEMLSDPAAEFSKEKRFEYAEIVRACAAALHDETNRFLELTALGSER